MRKLHPFPNGLGYEFRVAYGYWDLWKPDGSRTEWRANFTRHGETYAAKSGTGPDYASAMFNATDTEREIEEKQRAAEQKPRTMKHNGFTWIAA